jgi:hypothetical protein
MPICRFLSVPQLTALYHTANGSHGLAELDLGTVELEQCSNPILSRPLQAGLCVGDLDGRSNSRAVASLRLLQLCCSQLSPSSATFTCASADARYPGTRELRAVSARANPQI